MRMQFLKCVFGETSIRRDLAAEDGQHGRSAVVVNEMQLVVASDARSRFCFVFHEWPHTRVTPQDILRSKHAPEITIGCFAEIFNLLLSDRCRVRISLERHVGRTDQSEMLLERYGEYDPPVWMLEQERLLTLVESRDDDMTPLDQSGMQFVLWSNELLENLFDPWSSRIHDRTRAN